MVYPFSIDITYPFLTASSFVSCLMSAMHPGLNPVDYNGLCLLSLDGGGVRGLSSLYIVKCIMSMINLQHSHSKPLKPCDVFDMIAGTSTGG